MFLNNCSCIYLYFGLKNRFCDKLNNICISVYALYFGPNTNDKLDKGEVCLNLRESCVTFHRKRVAANQYRLYTKFYTARGKRVSVILFRQMTDEEAITATTSQQQCRSPLDSLYSQITKACYSFVILIIRGTMGADNAVTFDRVRTRNNERQFSFLGSLDLRGSV